jgi:fatty-acyl-CoA synthase
VKALQQIIRRVADNPSRPWALATLVRADGSTYRKPGARMLIDSDGGTTGVLSGGCLEEEIGRHGRDVIANAAPVLSSSRTKGLDYGSDAERLRRQASAGWPVVGVTVRVVDENMRDVPRDMTSIGEVVAMGDHVMEGYYREPEATRAVMSGPWFHTGDMAVWDNEGYLHIVDRKKEIIIRGGENIAAAEVEAECYACASVAEAAVFGAPDERLGEVPVAVIHVKNGERLDEEDLRNFLDGKLAKIRAKWLGEVK